MTPAARLAASIELLAAIDASPRPADAVANDFFRGRRYIGAADRRAVSEATWEVLRAPRRLAWWLARAGAPATPRLRAAAAALLRPGGSLPVLTRLFSGGQFAAAPLAPAELAALAALAGHTLEHPAMPEAVRLELPDWLLPHLAARFGPALAAEATALLAPAALDLRTNLLKTTRDEARAALAAEGIEAVPTPFSPWGLRIAGRRNVTAGAAFRAGLVEIQDEGSQLVALLADARPGQTVADFCAGAGGKTLALAMTMQNHGRLIACDVSEPRLDGAIRRLRRAGVHNAERHLLTAGDKWAKRRAGAFDRVLVDAPCTGTGTWRRNPDARTRLTPQDLDELVVRQAAILDQAAPLVRNGGKLIYATCSLLAEENEAQVTRFLARHPDFAQVPLARAWPLAVPPPGPDPALALTQALALTPARHGTDGFFAAVLERR
ncbi:MAG TPA: RsmB/NOP family class I SAM-dependent RNA methyltransferase [Acetobacteraceae bacterium]|nr:RsmB/NOP family class I SAM-dependent RNA methyltransferase [Acetobacteraceae bacterium]